MYRHVLEELQKAAAKMQNSRIVVVTQEKFAEIIDAAKEIGAEALINHSRREGFLPLCRSDWKAQKTRMHVSLRYPISHGSLRKQSLRFMTRFRAKIRGMACAIRGEQTGNPCIFSKKYYRELMEITGDKGGKQIIKRYPEDVTYLKISDEREQQDVDVPL